MIRFRDMNDDDDPGAGKTPPPSPPPPAAAAPPHRRKPRGVPAASTPAADTTIYNPAQVAAMWGISHDKVLEFIKTGELDAFNVASKNSRRPQFKITGAALRAFQERRSGRDPARSLEPPATRRASRKSSSTPSREYF